MSKNPTEVLVIAVIDGKSYSINHNMHYKDAVVYAELAKQIYMNKMFED